MSQEEPKKSSVKSRAIAHRNSLIEHMAAAGVPVVEIAQRVGLKPRTVSFLLKEPESVVRVESIHAEIRSKITSDAAALGNAFDEWAPEVAGRLLTLARGETNDVNNPVPHTVSLNAVKEILDRAPSAPHKKQEGEGSKQLHIHLPGRQFENAQQALKDVGMTLDVESSSDE